MCRAILSGRVGPKPDVLCAIVLNIRNQRSHELLSMGVQEVYECNPIRRGGCSSESSDDLDLRILDEPRVGIIVIPPMENYPLWDDYCMRLFRRLKSTIHSACVFLSCYGLEVGKDMPHLDKLASLEKAYKDIAQKKPFSILRVQLLQQSMLHFSRLIQETGQLLVMLCSLYPREML
jgi:hypothetical protein